MAKSINKQNISNQYYDVEDGSGSIQATLKKHDEEAQQ